MALEEGAGYARLRIIAREGPNQVFRHLGTALGGAWRRQPAPKRVRGSLAGLLPTTVYHARYLDERSARLLHATLQPVGRSNLFRLELRLVPAKNTR